MVRGPARRRRPVRDRCRRSAPTIVCRSERRPEVPSAVPAVAASRTSPPPGRRAWPTRPAGCARCTSRPGRPRPSRPGWPRAPYRGSPHAGSGSPAGHALNSRSWSSTRAHIDHGSGAPRSNRRNVRLEVDLAELVERLGAVGVPRVEVEAPHGLEEDVLGHRQRPDASRVVRPHLEGGALLHEPRGLRRPCRAALAVLRRGAVGRHDHGAQVRALVGRGRLDGETPARRT